MKTTLLIGMLLIATNIQAQTGMKFRDQEQKLEGFGFMAVGIFLTTAPVAVSPYIKTPTLALFSVGCVSLITGIVMHSTGKRNEERRLMYGPGAISYRF